MTGAYMREALDLARKGIALASPNPMVGAVIVQNGEVVGRGFHTWDGMKHAEIHALEEAGARAHGAAAYVSLEPCSHTGRTPPCVDALLAAGIAKVVAASADPNPLVAGEGFRRLRAAGVQVEIATEFQAVFAEEFRDRARKTPRIVNRCVGASASVALDIAHGNRGEVILTRV